MIHFGNRVHQTVWFADFTGKNVDCIMHHIELMYRHFLGSTHKSCRLTEMASFPHENAASSFKDTSQWVKILATKPDYLISFPGTHRGRREQTFGKHAPLRCT